MQKTQQSHADPRDRTTSQVLTPRPVRTDRQTPADRTPPGVHCVFTTSAEGNKSNDKVAVLEEPTEQSESIAWESSRIKETKDRDGARHCDPPMGVRGEGKQEQHLRGIREVAGSVRLSLRDRGEKANTKGKEGRRERSG